MRVKRITPIRHVREHHAPVGALRLSHPGSEGYSGCIQVLGGAGGVGGMVRGGVCPNLPQRRSGPGSAARRSAEYQRFFSRAPVRSGSLWQIWTACVAAGPGQGLGRGVCGPDGGRAGASASERGPWAAVIPFWSICGDPVRKTRRLLRLFSSATPLRPWLRPFFSYSGG